MTIPDPLSRSTPTPFAAYVCIRGRAVRLETNSSALLERLRLEFKGYGDERPDAPDFIWRLVTEPNAAGSGERWPKTEWLSDAGLSLVNFGQRSFIAVDLEAREAIGFLEERFTDGEPRFIRLFLGTLITLTRPALGPAATAAHAGGVKVPLLSRQREYPEA